MKAGIRLVAVVCSFAALVAVGVGPSANASTTPKATTCHLSADEAESLGTSYVLPLKVKNTSCGKGEKVVIAFNDCRKARGGADGHCKSKVLGYKCSEGPRETAPGLQFSADVKCKNGNKKVIFSYTQNL